MTKASGIGQRFFVEGVDLSGDIGSLSSVSTPRGELIVTDIQKNAVERLQGLADGQITFDFFFNPSAGQAHLTLGALPSTDVQVMYLTSTTAGLAAFCIEAKQINYDLNRGADGSLTGSATALAATGKPAEWGRILAAKATHVAADEETGILAVGAAQTANGGVGYLQHFSADTNTVTYNIEDSANSTDGDDGDWVNLGSFPAVADPWDPIGHRVQVTGTVEKWVRATTTGGAFGNAVFAMVFRRGTAVDVEDLS